MLFLKKFLSIVTSILPSKSTKKQFFISLQVFSHAEARKLRVASSSLFKSRLVLPQLRYIWAAVRGNAYSHWPHRARPSHQSRLSYIIRWPSNLTLFQFRSSFKWRHDHVSKRIIAIQICQKCINISIWRGTEYDSAVFKAAVKTISYDTIFF